VQSVKRKRSKSLVFNDQVIKNYYADQIRKFNDDNNDLSLRKRAKSVAEVNMMSALQIS